MTLKKLTDQEKKEIMISIGAVKKWCPNCGRQIFLTAWKFCDNKECREDRAEKKFRRKNRVEVMHRLSTDVGGVGTRTSDIIKL